MPADTLPVNIRKFDVITNITSTIENLRQGDYLFLDIDDTLLLTGFIKYQHSTRCTEDNLPTTIRQLQESGIKVIGLTARAEQFNEETIKQLNQHTIKLDHIIFAPSEKDNSKNKQSTKGEALIAFLSQLPDSSKPKRVLMIDDMLANLNDIAKKWNTDLPDLLLYHYKPCIKLNLNLTPESFHQFPDDLTHYTQIESLGGGTKSTYKLSSKDTSNVLVLKYGAHPNAMKVEVLCNALYRALDVPIPSQAVYTRIPRSLAKKLRISPYGIFQVSEYIDDVKNELTEPSHLNSIYVTARKHFIAHVLLGNIDVAKESNFILDANGEAHLTDAGANLIFRAHGQVRMEDPRLASELFSFRKVQINENAYSWFGSLTEKEIKKQVIVLLEKRDLLEKTIWEISSQLQMDEQLRNQFLEYFTVRFDVLVARYCPELQLAKQDKNAHPINTAAGILTYTMIDDLPHILLAKRVRHNWWDNFGGKSDPSDRYLVTTASREVAEESNNQLLFDRRGLEKCPSHDLITIKKDASVFVYRLYLAEHPYINPDKFIDYEHTAYQWVPLSSIMDAIKNKQHILEEKTETIFIKNANDESVIILFPPLYHMLLQPPVFNNLERLLANQPLQRSHTQGQVKPPASKDKNQLVRPLTSPRHIKQQFADTLVNHLQVISQLKERQPVISSKISKEEKLTQSEVHLKIILGDAFQVGNTASNVRKMLEVADINYLTPDEHQRLIQSCVNLIENEKNSNEKNIYFYHACDSKVAFIYEVYTILYQILRADNNWPVFRANIQSFLRFEENINRFIQHYTTPEGINNNREGFNECSLSTNLFLFGVHERQSSFSIAYLLNNSTSRHLDINILLTSLFGPYNVSKQDILRLLKLYPAFMAQHGSALYQIALSAEEVNHFTYPAGNIGKENPFIDEQHGKITHIGDIINVLQKYAMNDLVNNDIKKYVSNLQARLFASPRLRLATNKITLGEIKGLASPAATRATLDEIHRAILPIAYAILCDARTNLDKNIFSFKILPSLYRQNFLSDKTANDADDLAQAILGNNSDVVREILNSKPALKNMPLTCHKYDYLGSKSTIVKFKNILPLELILKHSHLPDSILLQCFQYGELFAYVKNNFTIELFLKILAILPKELLRSIFALEHMDKVRNCHFASVLAQLPENFQLDFANQYQYKIDRENFFDVLNALSENVRLTFINNNLRYINVENFVIVLDKLPENTRLEFTRNNLHYITGNNLGCALNKLPENSRSSILESQKDKVTTCFQAAAVIQELPLSERLGFAFEYENKIKFIFELVNIARHLAEPDCLRFLKKYESLINSFEDLIWTVKLLPDSLRATIAHRLKNKVQDGWQLAKVLKKLPIEDRLVFANSCMNKVRNGFELAAVFNQLDESDRLTFARKNMNKVQEGKQLVYVLSNLPHALGFAIDNQEKLINGYQLANALNQLLKDDRLIFAKNFSDKIHDGHELAEVLSTLYDVDRLAFANRLQQKIQNNYQLCRVLDALPEQDRWSCAYNNKDKIKSGIELAAVLCIIPPEETLNFANICQDKIQDGYELACVIEQIPGPYKLSLAKSYREKIQTEHQLQYISLKLTPADQNRLKEYITNADKIKPFKRADYKINGFFPYRSSVTPHANLCHHAISKVSRVGQAV